MDSILINGIGSYAGIAKGGKKFTTTFVKGTKYLLRLINTSVDTTFVFSIDSHSMTVIAADFVPINPYITDHLVIGIGQRYHVVIEANPKYLIHQNAGYEKSYGDYIDSPEAFWIRTIPANGRRNFSLQCRDEEFENLKPWRKWYVGGNEKNEIPDKRTFRTGTQIQEGVPTSIDKFAKWAIGSEPMFLNFSNPTILELNKTANSWASTRVVIPENAPENTWVYLAIISDEVHRLVGPRLVVPAAHPIYLHGHDFALVQQSTEPWSETIVNITRDNPPRRDVVLLPQNGFIIIAFKADNPGAWLLHCHIAWHASSGLAMQILERQADAAQAMTPARLKPVEDGCKTWDEWFSNSTNLYHHNHTTFQDDSGI
ncbi:hypothetical protein MMC31_004982 [Peltigera leucophlebia]|nr:hypothetical protein [Peltigera leucophlebia]